MLFVGQVASCRHVQQGVEWITKITATAALDQWLNTQINKTYAENSKAEDIVRDLLNIFGLEIGVFQLVENVTYPRGRVCSGKLKDILTEIVVNECKSRMLIRTNQIIINNPADGVNKGYLLTPDTGLLFSSSDSDVTTVETPQTKGADAEAKKQSRRPGKGHACLITEWVREILYRYSPET